MEIEAKFSISEAKIRQAFTQIGRLGPFHVGEPRVRHLIDTYLDTPQWTLLHAGYACRQRQMAGKLLITLKGLRQGTDAGHGAIHRRPEWEVALPTALPPAQWPPGEARRRVRQIVGDSPLEPLFTLRQKRVLRDVTRAAARIAELSLDAVTLHHGGHEQRYDELEIELQEAGVESDLAHLIDLLQARWALEAEIRSKFERGLSFIGAMPTLESAQAPEPDLVLDPDDPIAEAARQALAFHYERMAANEAGTRAGEDIEALHDMRVATRRMRAALAIFERYLDEAALAPYIAGLRATGRALGPVRDLDVFWQKAQAYVERQDTPPDLGPLAAAWEAARRQARAEMLAHLDSAAYAAFKRQFEALLAQPLPIRERLSYKGTARPYYLRPIIPVVLYRRLARVRAFDAWVTRPSPELTHCHRLRIAIKRLRYALEFFEAPLTPHSRALIEQLKAVQDHLGDLQDAVVARRRLRAFLATGVLSADADAAIEAEAPVAIDAPDVAAYLKHQQAEIQRLLSTFPAVWETVQSTAFDQLLADAISMLWTE
jgi:CHAD domain-containing protein